MNKEEICFKLMELYYTNISLFKNCCMSLNNLFEKYNKMLEILVEGDEQMAKWKYEICGNEFENFHTHGFDNKIYCPLCFFKKENQDQKKQQKEFIKWLEDEIERKRLNATCTTEYNDYVMPLRIILQKYKEIIEDKAGE